MIMSQCNAESCTSPATHKLITAFVGNNPGELDETVFRYEVLFCDTHAEQSENHHSTRSSLENI